MAVSFTRFLPEVTIRDKRLLKDFTLLPRLLFVYALVHTHCTYKFCTVVSFLVLYKQLSHTSIIYRSALSSCFQLPSLFMSL